MATRITMFVLAIAIACFISGCDSGGDKETAELWKRLDKIQQRIENLKKDKIRMEITFEPIVCTQVNSPDGQTMADAVANVTVDVGEPPAIVSPRDSVYYSTSSSGGSDNVDNGGWYYNNYDGGWYPRDYGHGWRSGQCYGYYGGNIVSGQCYGYRTITKTVTKTHRPDNGCNSTHPTHPTMPTHPMPVHPPTTTRPICGPYGNHRR